MEQDLCASRPGGIKARPLGIPPRVAELLARSAALSSLDGARRIRTLDRYWRMMNEAIEQTVPAIRRVMVDKFVAERKIMSRVFQLDWPAQAAAFQAQVTLDVGVEVKDVLDQTNRAIGVERRLSGALREAGEKFATVAGQILQLKHPGFTPEMANWIDNRATKIVDSIDNTTREGINRLVRRSFEEGWTKDQLRDQINNLYDGWIRSRPDTIARTEAGFVSAKMQDEMIRSGPVPKERLRKIWVTARDDRVRDSHAALEGVNIPYDEFFPNGLEFPRDEHGAAEEVINCRCILMYEEVAPAERAISPRELSPLEEELVTSPPTSRRNLGRGANESFVVKIQSGREVVWKPMTGEEPFLRREILAGTYYRREAAAWDVAKVVGMDDMVPVTVAKEIDGFLGSAQMFVPNALPGADAEGTEGFFTFLRTKVKGLGDNVDDVYRSITFDYVMGNTDRHTMNWMVAAQGRRQKLKLIDNGLCLPIERAPLRIVQASKLSKATKSDVMKIPKKHLKEWEGKWDDVEKALEVNGIEKEAIAEAKKRYDHLMQSGDIGSISKHFRW